MKERPIPFSAPMVRAILSGTKTQTRRALKVQPLGEPYAGQASLTKSMSRPVFYAAWDQPAADGSTCCICPYGVPGDRLWVREAWRADGVFDVLPPRDIPPGSGVEFEADRFGGVMDGKLRPGMFMPRWASRIALEVTGVRVERLQDIGEADASAEGIVCRRVGTGDHRTGCRDAYGLACNDSAHATSAVQAYADLWEQINGPGSWDANPWVWCIEFRRVA
jgi:hypothetical protein